MLSVKSRVNQPERVFLNSNDDPTDPNNPEFFIFSANFQTPILDAKRAQLIRASVPFPKLQLPDYQLCFFYFQLPTAVAVPSIFNLKCIRLYPSNYLPPAGFSAYTVNRNFNTPSDLVSALNTAASVGGDNATYNTLWGQGDIVFAYNSTLKQIEVTGNTPTKFYAIAGWNDPIVRTVLANPSIFLTTPNAFGGGVTAQPVLAQTTLNLRLGYAYSGTTRVPNSAGNASARSQYANVGNNSFPYAQVILADSYPNLVYTNNIYLYTNFCNGSSVTSNNRHNLLAVLPVNAISFGIVQYVAATTNLLTKLSQTIQNITIEMRDDNDIPYYLPDSAVVNVELAFSYQDKAY